MSRIWLNRAGSFSEAERFDRDYYSSMGAQGRLETVQFLRQLYRKFNKGPKSENGKRLRRLIKVIQ